CIAVCAFVLAAGCSSSSSPAAPSGDSGKPADGSSDGTVTGDATPPMDAPADSTAVADGGPGEASPDAPSDATAPIDCNDDDGSRGLPRDLTCTGLYSDWATKTIDTANKPYTPGYVLWSDNANKSRYLYLPPGAKIDTTDMDNWVFPVGTKIWKEFALGPLRIETRHFVKTASGWTWTTYRWTADGESGATQLDTGETGVNGTLYEVPTHGACLQCHGGRTDMVLGLDVINLGASTAVGLKLADLIADHRFTTDPPSTLEIPEDSSGLARASLGWLHTNCGITCHNPSPAALASGTGLFMKISGTQLIAGGGSTPTTALPTYVTAVNQAPNMLKFSNMGFYRIVPGHPEISLIPTLDIARNDPNVPQMPPIVTHLADTKDVDALIAWIRSMPGADAGSPDAASPDAGSPDAGSPDAQPGDASGD
ncbi:MAG: hypothetical protein ACRENE_13895, partial [Polyangiaceae bacterium]